MESQTIVEYFSDHEAYKCGYCKQTDTNYSRGMWAHQMTAEVYQNLIDRGWRRSGKYIYKPTNNIICCPMYPISQKAIEFSLSTSQKKVMKRFNAYLQSGLLKKRGERPEEDKMSLPAEDDEPDGREDVTDLPRKEGRALQSDLQPSNSSKPNPISKEEEKQTSQKAPEAVQIKSPPEATKEIHITSESKPRKAKELRIERKRAKLQARGEELQKKQVQTGKKSLEDFILRPQPSDKVKMDIKHVLVDSAEFELTFEAEYNLYKKYQMLIHEDEEDECTSRQFRRFLVDSPLIAEDVYGSYHQQYWIDSKLIAVGVIDVLSKCVSSVYFFYDPDYHSLTLGTYGALREISFVRHLNSTHPNIQHYYLGFYIHSCKKMRYKGQFYPSFLLCPETYTWHLLDSNLRQRLDTTKYCRLESSTTLETPKNEDISKVLIMNRRTICSYDQYKSKNGEEDMEEIQQFCNLVGASTASKILLFRS